MRSTQTPKLIKFCHKSVKKGQKHGHSHLTGCENAPDQQAVRVKGFKTMRLKHRTSLEGFSLIELVVAMFVFTILAAGLSKSIIHTQQVAEDNLYEATALTVASSMIEQIKGVSYALLTAPIQVDGEDGINMLIGNGQTSDLILGEFNELDVPIVTNASGSTDKTMTLRVNPMITLMDNESGYWIEVEYEYDHPKTGRTRSHSLRNARSAVPNT